MVIIEDVRSYFFKNCTYIWTTKYFKADIFRVMLYLKKNAGFDVSGRSGM